MWERCILDIVAKQKKKLLTVKFELRTLAEFAVVAELNRARTVSEFVHRFAVRTIEEAKTKQQVSEEEFERRTLEKQALIMERSVLKSAQRKNTPPKEDGVNVLGQAVATNKPDVVEKATPPTRSDLFAGRDPSAKRFAPPESTQETGKVRTKPMTSNAKARQAAAKRTARKAG